MNTSAAGVDQFRKATKCSEHAKDFPKIVHGFRVVYRRVFDLVFAFVKGVVPCLIEEFAQAARAHRDVAFSREAGIFCAVDFPELGFFHASVF